jgi:hypothetical protein
MGFIEPLFWFLQWFSFVTYGRDARDQETMDYLAFIRTEKATSYHPSEIE